MASDLRRCVASIKPYADRIIVVEGLFGKHWRKGANYQSDYSTDNTYQTALELGCEVIHCHGLLQNEQRDLYLRGREGDVYFVIDADMTLEGTLDKQAMLYGEFDHWAAYVEDPNGKRNIFLWAYRHIGTQPRHHSGNILEDGYGKLMDGSYPKGDILTNIYLKHYNMQGRA